MPSSGFWSYVRADDDAEQGRISALADDLAGQYAAITTEPIQIFTDKSALGWGDDWEARIEEAVVRTSFFIPVVSPRYLVSEACRRELQLFLRKAEALGLTDLVMPLVWFDVPELHETDPTDAVVAIVKRFHWVDWREIRFEDRASGAYRRAVAELAQRLVNINARLATNPPVSAATEGAVADDLDSTPGPLDLMAVAETAMPEWLVTLSQVREEIESVGDLARAATAEMEAGEKHGKGFAGKLTAARKFGQALEPHAERIEDLGNDFTTHLYNVDGGIRSIYVQADSSPLPATELEAINTLSVSIRGMAQSSRDGLGALQSMVESIEPIESMSRDTRGPLRKLRKGLTVMVEGQRVIDEWERLAHERN